MPKLNDRVQGKYQGQSGGRNWFDGVVTAVHEDGTCDLLYDDGDYEERVAPRFIKVIDRSKPFKILPQPLGKGEYTAEKDIHERRNILTTWAKLTAATLGSATMLRLDEPYQDKRPYSQSLEAGTYLFHAFPGSKATLDGGLKPMSFAKGSFVEKLDGQCFFNASMMGAFEHVYDNHSSAIIAKGGLSIAALGPGVADDYYAHVAGK
jgi:hypothetical protein